jgi:glucose-1-phosphate thymidylyltransferase
MKLIIPMAGRGTRVRPHSHVTPKPLLPVRGRTMVERIVDTFGRVLPRPIDEAVFVLGPDFGQEVRDQLSAICEARNVKPHFAVQHTAEGTAHAVQAGQEHLEGEGIVVFADTVFDMEPVSDLGDADAIAWVKHVEDPSRFGVAVREGDRITAFVEKPAELISNEALIGIYYIRDLAVLRREIQRLMDEDIRGHGREFQLTDALDGMLKAGLKFTTASVSDWLDCGTIPALVDTTRILLEKEQTSDHEGEVVNSILIDPVYIARGVRIENSIVGPYVSIEEGASVRNTVIRDSIVFGRADVEGVVLHDSLVGRHAEVKGGSGEINIGDHSTAVL